MSDATNLEALIRNLTHTDPQVRLDTVAELGHIDDWRAAKSLARVLRTDPDARVRAQAARALREIWSGIGRLLVAAVYADADADVKLYAAGALSALQSSEVIHVLGETLRYHPDPEKRAYAASCLGHVQHEVAAQLLAGALQDSDRQVREGVLMALREQHSGKAASALLSVLVGMSDDRERALAAKCLGDFGGQHKEIEGQLITALGDASSQVRSEAAEALGKRGSRNAVGFLIERLHDQDSKVQWEAITSLESIRPNGLVEELQKLLENPDLDSGVRHRALSAIDYIEGLSTTGQSIVDDQAEYLFARYTALSSEKRYKEARSNLDRAIELAPANQEYLGERAEKRYLGGQYELAIEDFHRLIALDPPPEVLKDAYDHLLVAHEELGQHPKAMQALDWLIEHGYGTVSRLIWRSDYRHQQGLLDEAMADLDAACAFEPRESSAFLRRGLANYRMGNPEAALPDFTEAVRLATYSLDLRLIHHSRAEAYLALGRSQEALDDLNEVLRLAGQSPLASLDEYDPVAVRQMVFKRDV